MAILMMFFAALLAAVSNFCMRRSCDGGGSTRAYLLIQAFLSLIAAFLLNPVRTGHYTFFLYSVLLGLITGVIVGSMVWSIGRAIERGPPGLTFASINAVSVLPALILALTYGGGYSPWQGIGSLLVVAGLFWAGWRAEIGAKRLWLSFVATACLLHVLLLLLVQWRAQFAPWVRLPELSQWFHPMIFVASGLIQLAAYLRSERRLPTRAEWRFGIVGGLANGAHTFFLILAPVIAVGWQASMLFPFFVVTLIILNNFWGQFLYGERVNWVANGVCLLGVILGMRS